MYAIYTKKNVLKIGAVIVILSLILYSGIHLSGKTIFNAALTSAKSAEDWSNHFATFKPSEEGYSVLVDLDNLTLYLYNDGEELKTWQVSGGTKETPSPVGSWQVSTVENWTSGFGGSWIGLNVPWGKYGIHGTVEPWVIGNNNASHGCIRMNNADAAELKEYMSVGVPVNIKHDTAPFRTLKDGDVGSDVLQLQIMLEKLGYYSSGADGFFSRGTFEAVCQFQKDEGKNVDGIAGYDTWIRLQEYMEN